MRRIVLLAMALLILSPQILFMFTRPFDECWRGQLGLRNFGLASTSSYVNVNVSVVNQMIETNPDLVILDVRSQSEYDSGHIQNATLIPSDQLAGRLGELDKQKDILVYCAAGGRSATASQILVDNGFSKVYNMLGGITAWKNAGYWIEIIHNGNLVVSGTETLTIENCTYVQTGNIYVQDSATFMIRNSAVRIDQTSSKRYDILIENNSTIHIEYSKILSPFWYSLVVTDYASANINGLSMIDVGLVNCVGHSLVRINDSSLIEIHLGGNSDVTILDSEVKWTTNLHFDSPQLARLQNLRPGFCEYWSLYDNQTDANAPYRLTLQNTYIHNWGLMLDHSSAVEVTNSTLTRIIQGYSSTECEIRDISPGFYANLTIGGLEMIDSILSDHWHFDFTNSDFNVERSSCHIGITESNGTIIKSIISWLNFYESGIVFFNETLWTGYMEFYSSNVYIYGNLQIQPTSSTWVSSNVTRNYNIILRNINDSSVADVELTLHNQNNTVVWFGLSDSIGEANFNLTFTDTNYTGHFEA